MDKQRALGRLNAAEGLIDDVLNYLHIDDPLRRRLIKTQQDLEDILEELTERD